MRPQNEYKCMSRTSTPSYPGEYRHAFCHDPPTRAPPPGITQVDPQPARQSHRQANSYRRWASSKAREFSCKITVCTRHRGLRVEIPLADTGTASPKPSADKIFRTVLYEQKVAKAPAKGLNAHSVVSKKHAGTLRFEPKTCTVRRFFIRLPIRLRYRRRLRISRLHERIHARALNEMIRIRIRR